MWGWGVEREGGREREREGERRGREREGERRGRGREREGERIGRERERERGGELVTPCLM